MRGLLSRENRPYHHGRKYKNRFGININIKRSFHFHRGRRLAWGVLSVAVTTKNKVSDSSSFAEMFRHKNQTDYQLQEDRIRRGPWRHGVETRTNLMFPFCAHQPIHPETYPTYRARLPMVPSNQNAIWGFRSTLKIQQAVRLRRAVSALKNYRILGEKRIASAGPCTLGCIKRNTFWSLFRHAIAHRPADTILARKMLQNKLFCAPTKTCLPVPPVLIRC